MLLKVNTYIAKRNRW